MARGFLSGAVMGGVVSVAVAGAASLLSGDLAVPQVSDAAPGGVDAPAVGEAAQTTAQTTAARDADLVQDGAAQTATPTPDDVVAAKQAGEDRPTVPQAGNVQGLGDPSQGASSAAVEVDGDAPVLPSPQAVLPEAETREELSISTDPAQPPAPSVPDAETAFETPSTDAPAQPQAPDVTGQAAPDDVTSEDTNTPETQLPETSAEPDAQAENNTTLPTTSNAQAADPERRPTIGQPAGSLVDRTDDTPEVVDTAPAPTEPASDTRPIVAFAQPFERSEDKPLMSIVLIDQGTDLSEGPVGLAALRSFPYPITFAIDPNLPDAASRMTGYRAQGFEVLILMDLPTGATPTDAEVTLDVAFSALPEAVGVLEGVSTGVQENREASDQVTQILAASGHGFVVQSKGLNTAQKLAARAGVPSATVFRDFDSADQTPTVIRRFLDQAAFRAGQEGGVIMMGRLRADTISALILWGLQDRASRVDLAPVSALLGTQDDG
ncbi:divergent polysaccharide deacetylase family protein [Ascidiaceihabitans sp.]|uniref:divergent polysaccharide deacetylase family protein n=1 Tax=Ascidiaceihabitans sp. TaxID=1872644 RepID=UPI003298FAD5